MLGIGDDMAALDLGGRPVLITGDMLLDGVHFDSTEHSLKDIGRKAAACSLSDCAAMAVRPLGALVSLALPRRLGMEQAKLLTEGITSMCASYGCELVGGDTTSWENPLVVDVAMLATPYTDITPVRRDGGCAGDGVYVTGTLGGSRLGKHLTFTPRVREARAIAELLGAGLHAMIDLSDGLAIDLDRVGEASRTGAVLDEALLVNVTSDAAREAAGRDGRSALDHLLGDGEDFELLVCAEVAESVAAQCGLARIGWLIEGTGLRLRSLDGTETPLTPQGYQHL